MARPDAVPDALCDDGARLDGATPTLLVSES